MIKKIVLLSLLLMQINTNTEINYPVLPVVFIGGSSVIGLAIKNNKVALSMLLLSHFVAFYKFVQAWLNRKTLAQGRLMIRIRFDHTAFPKIEEFFNKAENVNRFTNKDTLCEDIVEGLKEFNANYRTILDCREQIALQDIYDFKFQTELDVIFSKDDNPTKKRALIIQLIKDQVNTWQQKNYNAIDLLVMQPAESRLSNYQYITIIPLLAIGCRALQDKNII